MSTWRCLHPRILLYGNYFIPSGAVMGGLAILLLYVTRSAGQAWNHAHVLILLGVFVFSLGWLQKYWELRSESLLRLQARFEIRLFQIFALGFLGILAGWIILTILATQVPGIGVAFILIYMAFWGVAAALYLSIAYPGTQQKPGRRGLLLFYFPTYSVIFVHPFTSAFLNIPPAIAIPIGAILLGIMLLAMGKTPQEWRTHWQRRQHWSWRFPVRKQKSSQRASVWRWMPTGWESPPFGHGALAVGLPAGLLLLPLLPLGLTAIQLLQPASAARLLVQQEQFLAIFWLIPVAAWGFWIQRHQDWAYLSLNGSAGGSRRTICRRMLWQYAKHSALLSAAMLPWVALGLWWQGYGFLPIFILLLLWSAMQVTAWAAIGSMSIGLPGPAQGLMAIFSIILIAIFLLGGIHYWFSQPLVHLSYHLRLVGGYVLGAVLAVALAAGLAYRRWLYSDWWVEKFTGRRVGESVWGPWASILLIVAFMVVQALIAVGIVTLRGMMLGIIAGVHSAQTHHKVPLATIQAEIHHISPSMAGWIGLLSYTGAALLCLGFLWSRLPKSIWRSSADTGLAWGAPERWQAWGMAILLVGIIFLIEHEVLVWMPPPQNLNPHDLGLFNGLNLPGPLRYLTLFLVIVGAPFTEEILFRGALYAGLRKRLPVSWSAVIVIVLFTMAHLPSKIGQFHYPPAIILIALDACVLTYLRIRYRSLWPGILTHSLINSSAFLLFFWKG